MRLLLDEHYSRRIAEQLRRRGHDVVAARERSELHALTDAALFALMTTEGRVIVTENVADFLPLVHAAATIGMDHAGIILTSSRQFPRTSRAVGRLVRALDALLVARPAADALRGQTWWLEPA